MSPASQISGMCPGQEFQCLREGRNGGRDRQEVHPDSLVRQIGSPAGREEAQALP